MKNNMYISSFVKIISGLELKCPPAPPLLRKTRKIFATHFGEL